MATYQKSKISKIELNNASGTVCSLECYYKVNEDDAPKRIGATGKFPVGQSKTLNLDELDIPDRAWVTAYANVRAGKDSSGDVWHIYEKGYGPKALFTVTGTAFKTKISFSSISDQYGEDFVDHLKLNNQSGTVCSLECYYKKEKNDNPTRIGSTGNITVGLHKELNLDELDIPDLAWVNAYANVVAGSDEHGNIWFQYKKNCKKEVIYTISGVINFTTLSFDKITKLD